MIALLALTLAAQPVAEAERGFAAMAQRDGQWTAFRATATADAVMFVPGMVAAQSWLKGRADPPRAVAWSPDRTLTACDVSVAFSTGGWTGGSDAQGRFRTIWVQTQAGWRWVVDEGAPEAGPAVAVRPLEAETSSCSNAAAARAALPRLTATPQAAEMLDGKAAAVFAQPLIRSGASDDATLAWQLRGNANTGRRVLLVWTWTGTAHDLKVAQVTTP